MTIEEYAFELEQKVEALRAALVAAKQRIREEHDAAIRADEQRLMAVRGEAFEKARAQAAEQERDGWKARAEEAVTLAETLAAQRNSVLDTVATRAANWRAVR